MDKTISKSYALSTNELLTFDMHDLNGANIFEGYLFVSFVSIISAFDSYSHFHNNI